MLSIRGGGLTGLDTGEKLRAHIVAAVGVYTVAEALAGGLPVGVRTGDLSE